MTSSVVAYKAASSNAAKAVRKAKEKFAGMKEGILTRYEDSGTSGAEQQKKELAALEIKRKAAMYELGKKQADDLRMLKTFGKDAMKGRTFAQFSEGGSVKNYQHGGAVMTGRGGKFKGIR
tara:strand:- start:2433 stop:2795 length:363 start_codon:yes stop_codon:yes gene_type:complete